MNEFQIALSIGAILVALVARDIPRAHLWIVLGVLSFVASTAYARYDLPYAPAFTMSFDAAICLMIYFFSKEAWEDHLYRVFQGSVLVSLVYLSGPLELGPITVHMSHWVYVAMLEICNWLALAAIIRPPALKWIKGHEIGAGWLWGFGFHSPHNFGRSARAKTPFHKAKKW